MGSDSGASGHHASDDLYQEAIGHLTQSRAAVYLARTYTLYGEWLRWEKRRRDARRPLRAALDMYGHMGAEGLADPACPPHVDRRPQTRMIR